MLKSDQEAVNKLLIVFKMVDQGTEVIFNGNYVSVGDVLLEQRKKKPDCQVNYHTAECLPSDPSKVSVKTTRQVAFEGLDDEQPGGKVSVTNLGNRCELELWKTKFSDVVWHVRWTAKGLMPIKPSVVFTEDIAIPAGHAALLAD